METLQNKNLVVIGASRGLGRKIVIAGQESGAHVLAVARRPGPLAELSAEQPAVRTLALDATEENAPERVFETLRPDVLVLCGGAIPHTAPLQELNWEQFSRNWNSDVRISFQFCQAALRTPLAPGATILLISSGAAIGGSPVSGGYAGAKRMQMFLAGYGNRESQRLQLGLRFAALAPMRIMPETELGQVAVDGYARYLGLSREDFIAGMEDPLTLDDVTRAVMALAAAPTSEPGTVFTVSAKGVDVLP